MILTKRLSLFQELMCPTLLKYMHRLKLDKAIQLLLSFLLDMEVGLFSKLLCLIMIMGNYY